MNVTGVCPRHNLEWSDVHARECWCAKLAVDTQVIIGGLVCAH